MSDSDTRSATPSIRGLLVAQFFGAFNDNAFRMMVALLAFAAVSAQGEAAQQAATTTAFVVFTLPLMLFSLPAMALGDRVGKRALLLWTKAAEIVLMLLGTVALFVDPVAWPVFAVLAAMGAQSALFAPAKYGILPEILPHDELTAANGRLEAASFAAIVLGAVAGGLLVDSFAGRVWIGGAVLTGLAVVGFAAACSMPAVAPGGRPEPVREVVPAAWRALRGDRVLWLAMLGSVVFWGLASLLGQDVMVYAKKVLALGDDASGVPYAVFAVGVGAGSLLAGRLAKGKVEMGLIPLGSIGLCAGVAALGLSAPGLTGTLVLMTLLGVASGLVVVPLNALVQWRAPAERRGAVIALVNGLSFAGILAGAFACSLLAWLGADAARILVVAAGLTCIAMVWSIWLLPVALLRTVVLLATQTLYRVRVIGLRQVPTSGGALLVPNHVSFLDGVFLLAAIDRPIRFVVDQHWYERPYLKPFLRALGAIPIAATGGPRVVLRALRDAGKALDDGELVCLFAEGEISRMGSTLPFRRGMQRIVKGRRAPVVPVHLGGVYGGLLSPRLGRVRWWPAQVPYPVTVAFGAPFDESARPQQVRHAVDALGERAWRLRARALPPLHVPVVRQARRAPWRRSLADSQGRRLSRLGAVAAAVVLARRLRAAWSEQQHVGILLPPSIGGALAAMAASLAGRTAVPLNYTIGPAALASCVRQAGLRTVLTSRAFLDRMPTALPDGVEVLLLEDVLADARRTERWGAALRALLWPIGALERACGAPARVTNDATAAVVFSSGSTGEPKGVELTHANVHANCEQTAQVMPLDRGDTVVGVLPLFHSFGNMALWYALHQGAAVVFHPNPLDAVAVGDLVARHAATILLATPTFLQLYHRRCEPGQFGSLRIVLTGAEKLPDSLADAFADRFGIRPVQGYGCTECAPVVAANTPGYRAPGFHQAGSRRGSVGRPLPGVVVTIVDPDTREPLPAGESGLVLVRGPNVMRGYLGRADATAAAMHDGNYVTGDIGRLDEDGFLFLTDRLSRFSKIGGEMVPHVTVEEHLQQCSEREERAFAVCGVPDERKGERLMVLTTVRTEEIEVVLQRLAGRGLPPLFVPRRDQFVRVDELPMLGTGKLDLRQVRELCLEAARTTIPAR